ncbi:MAG: DUF882 domain-containing protein [Hyphomicrobiales bacterium]
MRKSKRGRFNPLKTQIKHSVFSGWFTAVCMGIFCLALFGAQTDARAEKRSLSFYFGHTKEKITVIYKRNGRYDKKGLKKLNWFFRDWRRNASTRMDPELFDLIWELKTELRARKPIHVISGFRSSRTNKKLRRMGRKVARRSQHIRGRAIDLYFPDVKLSKVRNAALVREVGGVGYYPRSGKHGFIHVDTGNVRHWPRMSRRKLARIFRDHKKRRKNTPAPVYIAKRKDKKKTPVTTPSPAEAATIVATAKPRRKPAAYAALSAKARAALASKIATSTVPVPRPKPYAVLASLQGQKDVTIQPASAPVQVTNFAAKRDPSAIAQSGTLGALPLDITPSGGSGLLAAASSISDPVPGFWKASRRDVGTSSRTAFGKSISTADFYQGTALLGPVGLKVASASPVVPGFEGTNANSISRRKFTANEMARIKAQTVNRNGKTNLARTPAVRLMRPQITPLNKQAKLEIKRMESIAIEPKPLAFE